MDKQVGGRDSLGYTKQDQKNYTRSTRQKKMVYGKEGCVLKYYSDQRLKYPSFFYSIQLDNKEKMMDFFISDQNNSSINILLLHMIINYGQLGMLLILIQLIRLIK